MSTIQQCEAEIQVLTVDETFGDLEVSSSRSNYESIHAIEAELCAYRRGSLRIRIDFDKHMIFWKDSRQWNNNFFRSVSPIRMTQFLQALPSTHLLEWHQGNGEDPSETYPACIPSSWLVSVFFEEESIVRFSGQNSYPKEWKRFKDLLESVARIPFCLR